MDKSQSKTIILVFFLYLSFSDIIYKMQMLSSPLLKSSQAQLDYRFHKLNHLSTMFPLSNQLVMPYSKAAQQQLQAQAYLGLSAHYDCRHTSRDAFNNIRSLIGEYTASEERPSVYLPGICPHCDSKKRFSGIALLNRSMVSRPHVSYATVVSSGIPVARDNASFVGPIPTREDNSRSEQALSQEHEEAASVQSSSPPSQELLGERGDVINSEIAGSRIALLKYRESFPNGHEIVSTPGTDLLCGFYAVIISMAECYPQLRRPVSNGLEAVFNSSEFAERTKDFGLTNQNYFHIDQVGAALYYWGTLFGMNLQVGCIREGEEPMLVPHPNDQLTVVVWIHHEPGHFSGLKPKGADTDSELNLLGTSANAPTEIDHAKFDERWMKEIEVGFAEPQEQDESPTEGFPTTLGLRGGGGSFFQKASDLPDEEYDLEVEGEGEDEGEYKRNDHESKASPPKAKSKSKSKTSRKNEGDAKPSSADRFLKASLPEPEGPEPTTHNKEAKAKKFGKGKQARMDASKAAAASKKPAKQFLEQFYSEDSRNDPHLEDEDDDNEEEDIFPDVQTSKDHASAFPAQAHKSGKKMKKSHNRPVQEISRRFNKPADDDE